MMKKTVVSLVTLLLLSSFPCLSFSKEIVIYHTSDIHGWYLARPVKKNSTETIGGFPALASMLKQEKKPYILLDSGDLFQGTPEGNITKGFASARIMRELGYTAISIGNHDFDFGIGNAKELSTMIPILGGNVYWNGDAEPLFKPYIIKEIDGIKIGIIGLASEITVQHTLPHLVAGLAFRDISVETEKLVKELRKQGIKTIIVLTHDGISQDMTYRTQVLPKYFTPDPNGNYKVVKHLNKGDVAVVCGGHWHTGLPEGYLDPKSGTLFVESGFNLTAVSKITLTFNNKTKNLEKAEAKLIPLIPAKTGEDQNMYKEIRSLTGFISTDMDTVIGETAVDLPRYTQLKESPMINFIADAIKKQGNAQIGLLNTNGVRGSGLVAGPITIKDIYCSLPIDNSLVTINVKGKDIIKLIEASILPERTETQMHVSGLEVSYIYPNPHRKPISVKINGRPISPNKYYKVATSVYLTSGKNPQLPGKNFHDTKTFLRDFLTQYIRSNPTITKVPRNRITPVSK